MNRGRVDAHSLDVPELTKERLELVRKGGSVTGLVPTVSDIWRSRIRGVVSSTDTTAIEVLGTVGVGQRPLANKRPERRVGVNVAPFTDLLLVSRAHVRFEDLVDIP